MRILRKFLLPFSILYAGVTSIRNSFYNNGVLQSRAYSLPVVCVGNLNTGGTGKSPMIEYLLELLIPNHKIATLSRGYGRKTKGFYLLHGTENANEVGDEPLQFKSKFPEAYIAVDEDRQRGIQMLKNGVSPQVILLDDAFQHRKVAAGLNILLTAYKDLYINDYVLPAGNLREPSSGAKRAQIVVVTKSPVTLSETDKNLVASQLKLEPFQQLFFSHITYGREFLNDSGGKIIDSFSQEEILLVTGIANPAPLVDFLSLNGIKFHHTIFPDHHRFTPKDLNFIAKSPVVITTEKDYMRLKDVISHPNLYYVPIKLSFIDRKKKFDDLIRDFCINEK